MERRKFLLTTALAASTTGCIGPFADDGGSEDGSEGDGGGEGSAPGDPEAAITRFIQALDEGDLETVNGMIHPEGNLEEVPEEQADRLEQGELTIESTEVREETDERAVVRVTVAAVSPEGQERTIEEDWELRTRDGEWRVWSGSLQG